MNYLALALLNLGVWCAQLAAVGLAAAAVARLAPVERPALRLRAAQVLLLLALVLPLLESWQVPSATVRLTSELAGGGLSAAGNADAGRGAWRARWPVALASLLAAGAWLQLLRLGRGLLRLRALARAARDFEAPPWLAALRESTAPAARLVLCEGVAAPATFGLFRPTVLLPPGFPAMRRDTQRAIALHELLHARRADWAEQLAEELLRAIVFFHPAVHWLAAQARLAREQCVDAEVVRRLGDRDGYLRSLVEVARVAAGVRAVPAAPFLRESHLRARVDLLLKEVSMSHARSAGHVVLGAGAVVLAAAWSVSAFPLQAKPAPADSAKVNLEDSVSGPVAPKLVHRVNPAYPAEAKAEKVEGIFRIDALIAKDGAIKDARVVASAATGARLEEIEAKKGTAAAIEGDARLADSALAAVRQWRYEPVAKDGKPVEAKVTITVAFKLS